MTWPFGELGMFGYRFLLIDFPWDFEGGGDRNARNHYPCMSPEEGARLPVGQLAGRDCGLGLWVTDPFLEKGIWLMRQWGFDYVSVLFNWAKTTKTGKWHFGTGYGTRANPELCLLGMTGNLGRPKDRAVRRLLVEPVREHSRKPDRVHADIERLWDGPYAELFARSRRAGWDAWGNEVGKFGEAA